MSLLGLDWMRQTKESKERQKADNDVAIHLVTVPVSTLSATLFSRVSLSHQFFFYLFIVYQ